MDPRSYVRHPPAMFKHLDSSKFYLHNWAWKWRSLWMLQKGSKLKVAAPRQVRGTCLFNYCWSMNFLSAKSYYAALEQGRMAYKKAVLLSPLLYSMKWISSKHSRFESMRLCCKPYSNQLHKQLWCVQERLLSFVRSKSLQRRRDGDVYSWFLMLVGFFPLSPSQILNSLDGSFYLTSTSYPTELPYVSSSLLEA